MENNKETNKPLYKKLLGNRVYLKIPVRDSKIMVDENTKAALDKAFAEKMMKAEVYDVGDSINIVEKGDIILVDPAALQKSKVIPLTEELSVLLVSPFDIIHIW